MLDTRNNHYFYNFFIDLTLQFGTLNKTMNTQYLLF